MTGLTLCLRERALVRLAPLTAALRMHTWQTWLLWLVGVLVLGALVRFDPALAVYLLDPEFVAGWVLFVAYYARQALRHVGVLARQAASDALWWQRLTTDYVRSRYVLLR